MRVISARSLSDLGDRSEQGGRARTEFHDIEAHSGSMQRDIGDLWANGTYSSGSTLDVGWMRHAVCAVIHRLCRQAHNKKDVVLLRNARWVTQKALTHPTLRLKLVPFIYGPLSRRRTTAGRR